MPINFPLSPEVNATYTYETKTWKWNGDAWERSAATETGNVEGDTGEVAYYYEKGSNIQGATNVIFYDDTNERLGIGTSGPTEVLDVRGGITASGGLYVGQGATFGGQVSAANFILPDDGFIGAASNDDRLVFDTSLNTIQVRSQTLEIQQLLEHLGDSDTYLEYTTDDVVLVAGGNEFLHGTSNYANFGGVTFGGGGATFDAVTVRGDIKFSGNYHIRNSSGQSIFDAETGTNVYIGDSESAGNATDIHIKDTHSQITLNAATEIELNTPIVEIDAKLRHKNDTNTYINFQTDQITMAAGGTDYINITSQGTNFADTEIVRPKLKDYAETVNAIGTITDDTTIDVEDGNVQTVTVGGDCDFDVTNWPATGIAGTVTLIITNGGAHTTTWDANIKWPGDNAPALTSSGVDILSFMTIDAGTTVYGFVGGINFS